VGKNVSAKLMPTANQHGPKPEGGRARINCNENIDIRTRERMIAKKKEKCFRAGMYDFKSTRMAIVNKCPWKESCSVCNRLKITKLAIMIQINNNEQIIESLLLGKACVSNIAP